MVSSFLKEGTAMITLEAFMDILALRRDGLSYRAIAARLGIHRNTVAKHLENGKPAEYRKQKRKESILAPYCQLIRDWLEEDDYRATWIFNKLKQLGFAGGYDTVKHYVRKVKARLRRQAYIRFETVPGLQAQMDWADFKVVDAAGALSTVYLFLLVLGFSRAMYAELVTSCTLQAFMDAHIRAFHYLRGVPFEILYDNMKHVVNRRTSGRAEFNLEFTHFACHYSFNPGAHAPIGTSG
jgi:transposase